MKKQILFLLTCCLSAVMFGQISISNDGYSLLDPTVVDSTTTIELTITSAIVQDVSITGVEAPFSISTETLNFTEVGQTLSFTVSLSPTTPGFYSDTISAVGTIFGELAVVFEGEGTLVVISTSLDTLNFGEVPITQTSTQCLNISNSGSGTMLVADINSTSDFLIPSNSTFTIDEGVSQEICFTFEATLAGPWQEIITVYSSDPNNSAHQIVCIGTSTSEISGNLCGNLSLINSPYVMVGNVTVSDTCSLEIEAGTLIQGGGYTFNASGSVSLNGTESDSIKLSNLSTVTFNMVDEFNYVDITSTANINFNNRDCVLSNSKIAAVTNTINYSPIVFIGGTSTFDYSTDLPDGWSGYVGGYVGVTTSGYNSPNCMMIYGYETDRNLYSPAYIAESNSFNLSYNWRTDYSDNNCYARFYYRINSGSWQEYYSYSSTTGWTSYSLDIETNIGDVVQFRIMADFYSTNNSYDQERIYIDNWVVNSNNEVDVIYGNNTFNIESCNFKSQINTDVSTVFENSVIESNGSYGINSSENLEVINSEIFESTSDGIQIDNNTPLFVSNSIIRNNSNSGIDTHGDIIIENSSVHNNGTYGVDSERYIYMNHCEIHDNNSHGIRTVIDLYCSNSVIYNNNNYGIYTEQNNYLDHLTIFGNSSYGLYTGSTELSHLKNSIVCLNNNSFNSQTNGSIEVFYSMTSGEPYFSDELGHLESYSDAVDAAMPWEVDAHMPAGIGKVRADMGAYGGPDNAYWGGQPVPDGSPVISSVADIPDDQGGYVGVEFDASIFDGDHTAFDVTHYSFWREMDLDGERSAGVYLYPEIETAGDQHRSGVEANWELVGEMTSNDFDAYGFTAATLADSVDGVVFPNTYVVIAHTLDDDVYWYSDTLSGYSVDNIAPNAPTELFIDMEYTAGRVVWSDPTDFDYSYSNVYRNDTYIGSTTTTSYLDATVEHMQEYEYQISHVDVHSNEGERASEFLLASVAPWTFESTSVNHTVNLPEDLALQMSGEGIQYGDYIGAFIEVDGELICIAQVMWDEQENSIVLHINQTIIGEPIVWVIYDASLNVEYLAQADYNIAYPQNATMLEGGLSQVLEFDINRTQTITIEQGWSMISANVDLGTNDIEDVMLDVSESIFVMKNDMGDVYWPDWSLNTIGDWQDGTGYLMKTSEAGELDVVGQPLHPETTPIVLDEGWNMMAYLPTAASGPEMALESMVDDIIIVKDALGNVYWPYYSLNTMGAMEPGKGYQLKVQNDVVFNYPRIDEEQRPINPVVPLVFYREALNTGSNMTLLIPQEAWIEAPQIGDEIVAYDANSNVVASVVYTGSNQVLTIWGDDVTTEIKEALVTGEAFYLNLWNKETETINKLEVYAFAQGDGTYTENDIQIISSIGTGTQMTAGTLHLKALIPNPSAGSVSIALSNPMAQDLELVIFNSLGEIVFSRESVNYLAGDHVLAIDLDHLESGAYFVKVISDVEMDLLPLQLIK